MQYNVKVKTFPDGTRQFVYSEKPIEAGYSIEPRQHTGENVERKERENHARAKSKVYDLARSNYFDFFVTLTFSPEMVKDRKNYDECAEAVKRFTKKLCKWGCGWIIVPEQHKDGSWHFHGLIQGNLPLKRAINPHTGKPMTDKQGREIYNIVDYEFGFTTAIRLEYAPQVATYLTKYFTKDMMIPKGRKRYWASRGLNTPTEERYQMFDYQFGELFNSCRYQKVIHGPYGSFLLCET